MSIAQRNGVNVIVGGSNRRVEVFRLHASGLPVVEGIMQAASKRLVVASNRIMDAVLSGVEWSSPYIRGVFPCWTGTMTGYNNAGAKLGKEIVYREVGRIPRPSGGDECQAPTSREFKDNSP